MSYEFKGFEWTELAECWGIKVEDVPTMVNVVGEKEPIQIGSLPEKIDIRMCINNTSMIFTTFDDEEVLAEKIKRHIKSNINFSKGEFKDKQVRTDLEDFLKALIKESKEIDYNHHVYEGILKVESDETFARWICNNLEELWT